MFKRCLGGGTEVKNVWYIISEKEKNIICKQCGEEDKYKREYTVEPSKKINGMKN